MSKRYSGKSFKDSSVKKKPKLGLREKRRNKKDKQKKNKLTEHLPLKSRLFEGFFKFPKKKINV